MLPVAIIGASGYSGEELVRLLLHHPKVRIACITSRQNAGRTLGMVFPKFEKHSVAGLKFIAPEIKEILRRLGTRSSLGIVFLALPHGVASEWAAPLVKLGVRVIDLSADFRLREAKIYQEFYGHVHKAPDLLKKAVYGLPEIYRTTIRRSRFVASPGCYPTSILLPLIPLLREKLIKPNGIIADSLSGVSGAGRKASEELLFCECNESMRPYGIPKHRHVSEIEQELTRAARKRVVIQFTPHLVPLNRGILSTMYVRPTERLKNPSTAVARCYAKAYGNAPFVHLLKDDILPDTKNVLGTNRVEIAYRFDPRTGRLILFSAEDNLTKGAAGQAVQSMNLMCGFRETEGLL